MQIIRDTWQDEKGRRLVLRGVNLGGDSKLPAKPSGASHIRQGFYERKALTFVGRPFPLEEAAEHFARLKRWGMNFLRLLVTWEGVEHEGPGIYDGEYLEYLERIVALAGDYGLSLFVDPHQDVWSRWTGGDGAPLWTLEAAGFEPERLHATGAAMVHQEHGDPFPRMIWPANYNRLACATMFTLFYGGDVFAPGIRARDRAESLQAFLQERFIGAMEQVARRIARYPHVVGFDSLNEPSPGFIGQGDLRVLEHSLSKVGPMPSPWEAIRAGSGIPVVVDVYGIRGLGQGVVGRRALGLRGLSAWRDDLGCLWARSGIWSMEADEPKLLRPAHFAEVGGRPVDFSRDFLRPFIRRYMARIRSSGDSARRLAVFIEGIPEGGRSSWDPAEDGGAAVNATHWYDGLTLFSKIWTGFLAYDTETGRIHVGPARVRRFFARALRRIRDHAGEAMGGIPTLIGEFGLPFDLNWRRAYAPGGNYQVHERALSAYYDALDANLLDATLWNYSADNSHARGDLWNGEDLSVFCRDEARAGRSETGDPRDAGGRALRGFVRPYAMATAGELTEMRFSLRSGEFLLRYRPDGAVSAPTEVFLPKLHYPRGCRIEAIGARYEHDEEASLVRVWAADGTKEVLLRITRA
ncbi:MAG TPA: cellulase family glycosylhydrolase [Rectinemataceae bacterium]|nr:cellulase family glycosylhydrolase [Rectinemataceae bacterium]